MPDIPSIVAALGWAPWALLPLYALGIGTAVDAVMTAHVSLPRIVADGAVAIVDGDTVPPPATLAPEILTELLVERMGFEGLVVTDWGAMNDRVAGGGRKRLSDIVLRQIDRRQSGSWILIARQAPGGPELAATMSPERVVEAAVLDRDVVERDPERRSAGSIDR